MRKLILILGFFFMGASFADTLAKPQPMLNNLPSPALVTPANNNMLNALGIKNSAQNIPFADNDQITLVLSNTDINRLAIQGDKIQNINAPLGQYTAKNDNSGSAYITLTGSTPFTMYLTTVGGHNLSLFVNPRPIVGKAVILQPTSISAASSHWEETSSYQKILVTLMSNMINKQNPDGYLYSATPKGKSTNFYDIANLKPVAVYAGSHLTGITYEIKNTTDKPIVLRPAYFYQAGIRAVALSMQTINPKQTAMLYEVMSR